MEPEGKVHPLTDHEGPEEEYRYSPTLTLTSALDEGGWSTPRPGRFTPGEDPVPIVYEAGWAPGTVWMSAENLAPIWIWSPDRPAHSDSLYLLSYPGPSGTRRFITKFTRTHPPHLWLSWVRHIQSKRSHLYLGRPRCLFPSSFAIKTLYIPFFSHLVCHMPRLSNPSSFDHPKNIWWGVQIMKLLNMQLRQSPVTSYLLDHKHLPRHPLLTDP
jgi:hypothetical protein